MAEDKNTSGDRAVFDEQFDSRLMNSGDSSSDKAGALAEAKRNGSNEEQAQEEPGTLREAVLTKKREEAEKEKTGEGGLKSKAITPIQQATSKLLKEAWINLIPSWGLTLLWINIHVFLRLVLGKSLFCRLGAEWMADLKGGAMKAMDGGGDKTASSGGAEEEKEEEPPVPEEGGGKTPKKSKFIKKLEKKAEEKGDQLEGCLNLAESMALAALDLILLLVIMIILLILALIYQIITHPIDFITNNYAFMLDFATNILSSWGSFGQ